MIVLHGVWSEGGHLLLWGEDALLPPRDPDGPEGRVPGLPPPVHPFSSSAEWVEETLGLVLAGRPTPPWSEEEIALLLPSGEDAPQASPWLLREDDEPPPDVAGLALWRVPACRIGAGDAAELLLDLPASAPPGAALGDSLAFMGEVARFALERVAAGRIAPDIQSGVEATARWRAVLTDDAGHDRAQRLARTLPPSFRSLPGEPPPGEDRDGGLTQAPPRSAADVVLGMLDSMVDALARCCVADGPTLALPRRSSGGGPAAAASAWVRALAAPEGRSEAPTGGWESLARAVLAWTRPALDPEPVPFRTCFRLSAPEGQEGVEAEPWRLEVLLQGTDDRSLLVPAAEVWRSRGDALTVLRRKWEHPQERLLGDLGRAVRLAPSLEALLRQAHPAGVDLDAGGAWRFLREGAPLLEQAGFGVLVPPWWGKPAAALGARLEVRPAAADRSSSGLLGMAGICAYRWRIALGDEAITEEELRRLAALKVPLVRVRGQWVELRREEVDAALAWFARRPAEGTMRAGEVLRAGLGLDPTPAGLPAAGIRAEGWVAQLLGEAGEARLEPRATPAAFRGTLRPYQERGMSWLSFLGGLGLGSCLADDMGLGKTVQVLALLSAEREAAEGPVPPTLLVCPTSVVGNWRREAERFVPDLPVHVHHGAGRETGQAFVDAAERSGLVITSYSLVVRDAEMLGRVAWGRTVLDEAQNIKNSGAQQTQAVRRLPAAQRIALTGTPVENRLAELWSILDFLNPGLLGSANDFRTRFALPIEKERREDRAALLRQLTGPFVLRRLKTDPRIVDDLPAKTEVREHCVLTREQATLYQAVVDDMLARVEASSGMERRGLVLATLTRLKQVCNHPAHLLQDRSPLEGRSGKLIRLAEVLEEVVDAGDRALVFTQFAEWGQTMRPWLQERLGREVLFLHGGTAREARDRMVARFQAEGGPPVLMLSLKAGGTGLNLTAANHVIHFDRWWNPAVEDQATDRAFRIGQKRHVQVRKMVCAGTLEERIDRMIEEKRALARMAVGEGEGWLTEMSTAELRDVIALSEEGVSDG